MERKFRWWDTRLLSFFITDLFLFEAISGFYTYFKPAFSTFSQFTILAHIIIGCGLLLPFAVYQISHFIDSFRFKGFFIKIVGYLSGIALIISCATGVYFAIVGVTRINRWLYDAHLVSSIMAAVIIILHIIIAMQKRYISRPILTALAIIILYFMTTGYKPVEYKNGASKDYDYKFGKNPFHPSETMTSTEDILDPEIMGNSKSCGRAGCHKEIYDEWYASAHRWSSTDITYRKTEEFMIKKEGIVATRYCGGCHDPIALMSGAMTPGGSLDSPHSEEGVSCIVCHRVTEIRHLRGSGSYLFTPPERYLYEGYKGEMYEGLTALLIRTYPKQHKETYAKDFYKEPEFCAVCHKQFLGKDTNHWGWIKLQDQYGSWLTSQYSGRNTKGFFVENGVKTCNDCHMRRIKADDPVAVNGEVFSHRYVAANTAIPWLNGDKVQYDLTEEWLKRREIYLDIYEPREKDGTRTQKFVSQDIYGRADITPYVTMGEKVAIQVAITNIGVGHNFPDGPIDIQQVWVEFKAVDSQNNVIYWSGDMDESGEVDRGARFYWTLGVDREGRLINKHNLWDMIGNVYARTIPPGQTDIATYEFEIPYWTKGDITMMARLRYRKFNQWFTNWVMGREDVRLPIIDMARDILTVGVKSRQEVEEVKR